MVSYYRYESNKHKIKLPLKTGSEFISGMNILLTAPNELLMAIFNDNIFSFKNTKNIMKMSSINPAVCFLFNNSINRKI